MDIKEIKETIQSLDNDLSNIKIVSKNTIIDLISNSTEYDKKAVIDCFCSMLGSIIKITSYDLKSVLNSLDSLDLNKEPKNAITYIPEPNKEEVQEVPDNTGNTIEEPAKELTYANKREIFKKRLRKLRTRNNTSIQELATMLNIRYSVVHAWESKGVIPRQNTLEELAKLFNVPSQYLVGEGE